MLSTLPTAARAGWVSIVRPAARRFKLNSRAASAGRPVPRRWCSSMPPKPAEGAPSASTIVVGAAKEAAEVAPLSRNQIFHIALYGGIPMVGFGIMDNLVMIQAGDAIDSTIGVTLGLHTLTAAAFGQIFSDLSGVMFGGTVEAMVAKMGLKPPAISPAQRLLPAAKLANTGGMAIGVVLGCLIGMTSLLFMDLDKNERLRREEELDTIFETVLDVSKTINSQACSLFMVDRENKVLWSRVFDSDATGHWALNETERVRTNDIVTLPLDSSRSVAARVVETGKLVNLEDAYKATFFNSDVDKKFGTRTKSMLSAPVFDSKGDVIAVCTVLNKGGSADSDMIFDENDEKLMTMLCSHVSAFLKHF